MIDSVLNVKDFWYRYPDAEEWILNSVNLEGNKGEMLLIAGPSGCGKSTLMKAIVGLIPHVYGGEWKGGIVVGGRAVAEMPMDEVVRSVGYVSQNPDNQIVSTVVREDVAFSMQNFGFEFEEMVRRVDWALSAMKISDLKWRPTLELSDGQKQRVALAGAIVLRPKILIVDEPTGFLDPWAARKILRIIRELSVQYGVFSIIVEHRIELLGKIADRALILENGRASYYGNVDGALSHFQASQELDVRLDRLMPESSCEAGVRFDHAYYRHPNGNYAVKDASFEIMPGELTFLVGPNGSGKSTLLRLLNGVYRPSDGRVLVCGVDTRKARVTELSRNVGLVMQNPDHQLFTEKVIYEIETGAKNFGVENPKLRAIAVAKALNIEHLLDRSPITLSWGEKKRVCIASSLAWDPPVLALDEPTVGQDPVNKAGMARLLSFLVDSGKTIIVATHDTEFVKRFIHPRIIHVAAARVEETREFINDVDWAPAGDDEE